MIKQFRNTELTNLGFSVSNKASLGKTKFETTRAVSTDVDLSQYKREDIKNLTSLPNEINSGVLMDYDMRGDNVSAIKIDFNNSKFKDGYIVKAVGIYAKEADSDKEFLHSVTVTDSPVTIPAVDGNVFDGFYLTVAIFSGSNKNISVKLTDETTATVKYVDDMVANLNIDDIKSHINSNEQRIKGLENTTMKFQGWLKDGDSLDDLPRVSGIWGINGVNCTKLKGYPDALKAYDDWDVWGYVKQTGTTWIKQEIVNVTSNVDNLVAYRIYENSLHNWEIVATQSKIDKALKTATDHADAKFNSINLAVPENNAKTYADQKDAQLSNRIDSIDLSAPEKNAKTYADQKISNLSGKVDSNNVDINNRLSSSINDLSSKIGNKVDSGIFNDLNSRALKFKGELQDGFDLNSMMDYPDGYYECYDKDVKNMPIGSKAWFVVSIINHADITLMTYADNWSNLYYRVASGDPMHWDVWRKFTTDSDLSSAINNLKSELSNDIDIAKVDLQNQINDRVNNETFNNRNGDLQNQINNKVSTSTFNDKTEELEIALHSKIDNVSFQSKTNNLQSQIDDRVNNDSFNDKVGSLQSIIDEVNTNASGKKSYIFSADNNQNLLDVYYQDDGYFQIENVEYQPIGHIQHGIMEKHSFDYQNLWVIVHDITNAKTWYIAYNKGWGNWLEVADVNSLQSQIGQTKRNLDVKNSNLQDQINNNFNNSLTYRGVLEDGTDLNDLVDSKDGYYDCFNKNIKNSPSDVTTWFIVRVMDRGGMTYMEYVDNLNNRFYRMASGYPKVWGQWLHIANFGDVEYTVGQAKNDLQNQINDLRNQLNNSLQFKGEAPNPLSNATAQGIYILPGNKTYSDQPDGTNRGQMFVLDTDGLTNQMILDNHGNVLNRSIGGNGTTKWK